MLQLGIFLWGAAFALAMAAGSRLAELRRQGTRPAFRVESPGYQQDEPVQGDPHGRESDRLGWRRAYRTAVLAVAATVLAGWFTYDHAFDYDQQELYEVVRRAGDELDQGQRLPDIQAIEDAVHAQGSASRISLQPVYVPLGDPGDGAQVAVLQVDGDDGGSPVCLRVTYTGFPAEVRTVVARGWC